MKEKLLYVCITVFAMYSVLSYTDWQPPYSCTFFCHSCTSLFKSLPWLLDHLGDGLGPSLGEFNTDSIFLHTIVVPATLHTMVAYYYCYTWVNMTLNWTIYLYNIVVFPAPSKPSIRILISFEPNNDENKFENHPPVEQTNESIKINNCITNPSSSTLMSSWSLLLFNLLKKFYDKFRQWFSCYSWVSLCKYAVNLSGVNLNCTGAGCSKAV